MPCRSEPDYDEPIRQRLDHVTKLLCGLCGRIEDSGDMRHIQADPHLGVWWQAHKVADAKRKAEEQKKAKEDATRKAALAKLTPAERKLLRLS